MKDFRLVAGCPDCREIGSHQVQVLEETAERAVVKLEHIGCQSKGGGSRKNTLAPDGLKSLRVAASRSNTE